MPIFHEVINVNSFRIKKYNPRKCFNDEGELNPYFLILNVGRQGYMHGFLFTLKGLCHQILQIIGRSICRLFSRAAVACPTG